MKLEKTSELVTLLILVLLVFPGATATGNGSSLQFTTPIVGKMPAGVIPKLTLGFEIALRGELEIEKEPQPHDINDIAKLIAELLLNSSNNARAKQDIADEPVSNSTVIENNEASSIVGHKNDCNANVIKNETSLIGDDKCVDQGDFCTSLGPFCCKPLLCVNFLLVGVGICEDLHS